MAVPCSVLRGPCAVPGMQGQCLPLGLWAPVLGSLCVLCGAASATASPALPEFHHGHSHLLSLFSSHMTGTPRLSCFPGREAHISTGKCLAPWEVSEERCVVCDERSLQKGHMLRRQSPGAGEGGQAVRWVRSRPRPPWMERLWPSCNRSLPLRCGEVVQSRVVRSVEVLDSGFGFTCS